MRCSRHNVGVREGGGNDTACDQAGYVGHVAEEVGAYLLGDSAHSWVVYEPAVGGCAGYDYSGTVEHG